MTKLSSNLISCGRTSLRLGVLVLLAGSLGATELAPISAQPIVAKTDAQKLLQQFLKCWESGDAKVFASLLDDQVVFAYPGGRFDRAGLIQTFRDYQQQKKEIRIYFSDFFVSNGQRHVTSYQFAATDRATGKRFAVGTGVIFRIRDGKIIEFKEYWDSEVAERQKQGDLPLDEGQPIAPWPSSIWLREEKLN